MYYSQNVSVCVGSSVVGFLMDLIFGLALAVCFLVCFQRSSTRRSNTKIEKTVKGISSDDERSILVLQAGCEDMEMKLARDNKHISSDIKEDEEEFLKVVTHGEEDKVKEILDNNPYVLHSDNVFLVAIHFAASGGHLWMLKEMFKVAPSNPQLKRLLLAKENINGDNAMHLSIKGGHEKTARYLVKVQPRATSQRNQNKVSPLILAIEKDFSDLVRYMTRKDNIPLPVWNQLVEHVKKTYVAHYALKKSTDVLHALLEEIPCLIDAQDKRGRNLLSYAALKGYTNKVNYILINFPTSARYINGDGSFPIHMAVMGGHLNVVEEFVLHCPEVLYDVDQIGQNCLELATKLGKIDIKFYLQQEYEQLNHNLL